MIIFFSIFSFVNSQIRSPPIYVIINYYIWRPLIDPDQLKQRLGASLASAHLGKSFLSTLRMVEIRSLNISMRHVLRKKWLLRTHYNEISARPRRQWSSAILVLIYDLSALLPTSVLTCDSDIHLKELISNSERINRQRRLFKMGMQEEGVDQPK